MAWRKTELSGGEGAWTGPDLEERGLALSHRRKGPGHHAGLGVWEFAREEGGHINGHCPTVPHFLTHGEPHRLDAMAPQPPLI